MKHKDGERLPDDLQEMVDRLRAHKPGATPLELDEIKLRAMAQASRASASRQGRRSFMRSKLVTSVLTLALVGSGGSAAVLAGGKGDHGNSGNGQYCPGKGHGKHHGKHGGKHGSTQNRGSHGSNCPPPKSNCGSHGSQCKSNASHNNKGSHNSH